jgi:hypothetical protein
MTTRATGTFEVKLLPLTAHAAGDPTLGRMSIDKVFHGDLQGTSQGEMLSAGAVSSGSAAYVAIERVTGTLHGRTGSFAVYHVGVMNRGAGQLTITVVPDSGTGELAGITGTMAIRNVEGKHDYDVDYDLPGASRAP